MTRVLLIDDRELFREGLGLLLSSQPDFQVVGEAGGAPPGYLLVESLHPDVVIIADELDGVHGATVTHELVRRVPDTRVLILSARGDEEVVHRAMEAGARGFALKQQPSKQVFEGVRAVAAGHVYLAPAVSHVVVNDHLRLRRGEPAPTGPTDLLSRRERDVFELLVRGNTNRRIARLLGISPKTVETHRAHVLRKIGVHSIVDLVRFAARHQLPLD